MTEFYEGGWRTNAAHPQTRITYEAQLPHTFLIRCTELVDGSTAKYVVTADGKTFVFPLLEGSSMVVEGKDIHIEQTHGDAVGTPVTWTAIQQNPTEAIGIQWTARSGQGLTTVLALNNAQEFVIQFNQGFPDCPNATMQVFIDGKVVVDKNGGSLRFVEGSSLLAYGSIVAVSADADCVGGSRLSGSIKLKRDA